MENDVLFSEKQRFKQWWIWVLLIGMNGFILTGIFFKIINDAASGSKEVDYTTFIIVASITVFFTAIFFLFRLDTQIKSDGIYVRFIPFRLKYRHITWEDLSKIYVRQYSPLVDYGGWGIRYSISGAGKAYNISGKIGLQLEFTNGKKLLIGTQKGEEIIEILTRIGQYKA